MLLILCPLDDRDAITFAHRAMLDGVPCRILTAEALSFATRRSHRLSSHRPSATTPGRSSISVRTEIEAVGLPPLDDGQLSGVLNRLIEPPNVAWQWARPVERDYAAAELFAFTLSWLTGLQCPVRNRPSATCLTGPSPHPLTAMVLAARSGLDCPGLRYSSRDGSAEADPRAAAMVTAGPGTRASQVICLDGAVLSSGVPVEVATQVADFLSAIDAGSDLVGVDFVVHGTRWIFAGLTPLPVLGALDRTARHRLLETLCSPGAEAA